MRTALAVTLAAALLGTASSKDLIRSRCSACEAIACELHEWFHPDPVVAAYEKRRKAIQELFLKDEDGTSTISLHHQLDFPGMCLRECVWWQRRGRRSRS